MKEPRCLCCRLPLTAALAPGVQECRRCRGLWVQMAHFEGLLASPTEVLTPLLTGAFPHSSATSEKLCPECGKLMRTMEFENRSGIALDICSSRHGVWFDRFELQRILAYRRQKTARERAVRFGRKLKSKNLSVRQYQAVVVEARRRAAELGHRRQIAKLYNEHIRTAYRLAAQKANKDQLRLLAREWDGFPGETYRDLVRLYPEDGHLHCRCGQNQLKPLADSLKFTPDSERVKEARFCFQAAFDREPGDPLVLCGLAEVWARLNRPEKAFNYLEMAAENGVDLHAYDTPAPSALFRVLFGALTRKGWREANKERPSHIVRAHLRKRCIPTNLGICHKKAGRFVFPALNGELVVEPRGTVGFQEKRKTAYPLGEGFDSAELRMKTVDCKEKGELVQIVWRLKGEGKSWSFEHRHTTGETEVETSMLAQRNCEQATTALGLVLKRGR